MLLVNSTAKSTKEAFEYINSHLNKTGNVYLIGDSSLIGDDFLTMLKGLGYINITKVSGNDRYDTDYLIAKELNISGGTPVVISSGENFPDALAVSSFAAANGWPILLTDGKALESDIKTFIQEKQPAEIYITGEKGQFPKLLKM